MLAVGDTIDDLSVGLWIIPLHEVLEVPSRCVTIEGRLLEEIVVGVKVHEKDSFIALIYISNFRFDRICPVGIAVRKRSSILLLAPWISHF